MANEKKPQLDSLKAKARLVGIDIDALKAELVQEVATALQSQLEEISSVDIEARLAKKLVDSMENVTAKLTEAVEGVRSDLFGKLGKMEQAVPTMVAQTVEANMPQMCSNIAGQLEENIRKSPPQGAMGDGGGIGAIISKLPAEFWANLASNLFGKKPQALDTGQAIRWLKIGQALKVGETKIEDLEQALRPPE